MYPPPPLCRQEIGSCLFVQADLELLIPLVLSPQYSQVPPRTKFLVSGQCTVGGMRLSLGPQVAQYFSELIPGSPHYIMLVSVSFPAVFRQPTANTTPNYCTLSSPCFGHCPGKANLSSI